MKDKLGCVIMASGHSRRFGSNKLLAYFKNKMLIEWVMEATEGLFDKRVVVTRYEEIASLCDKKGIECIVHNYSDRSQTIKLGLNEMGDVAGCMFVPADQPLLKKATIEKLCGRFLVTPHCIHRVSFGERVGMPVIFPNDFFGELLSLDMGGGSSVIKNHPDRLSFCEVANEAELMDADTPEMLEKLNDYE